MKFLIIQVFVLCTCSLIYSAPIEDEERESIRKLIQRDLILTPEQKQLLSNGGRDGRTGTLTLARRWPKIGNLVHVPYVISPEFSPSEYKTIIDAKDQFHEYTCIRFVPRTNETDFLNIAPTNEGCYTYLGRIGGAQLVSLQKPSCVHHGVIIHELIHALGFAHMHSDYDRDRYVRINWNNIQFGAEDQFYAVHPDFFDHFNTPYDYDSIMHYDGKAFSRNGQYTIETYNPADQNRIGQLEGFSRGDIHRINNMYNC
ncbi:hypothetical protein PVAND_003312 [Polypedilum vanderplanki]|uniref:Metalloendopeptidase n=1 Tax=Polypedilum vanderplanki TaxID=319348 RepID=A0A9J6BTN6_POLVA|nr:hypothetical protein PVAND_003312 [Polypedilum vanderplanki]